MLMIIGSKKTSLFLNNAAGRRIVKTSPEGVAPHTLLKYRTHLGQQVPQAINSDELMVLSCGALRPATDAEAAIATSLRGAHIAV